MNSSILSEWVAGSVEALVQMGVPRSDAESLMRYVRNGAIAAEAEARNDAQFLFEFNQEGGSARLAKRFGLSGAAIRKRRTKILSKKQPLVASMVAD